MKKKLFFIMMSLLVITSVNLSAQNLIAGWDGNDGAGGFYTGDDSKPNSTLIGWDNTNSALIPWTEANGSGGCRFRDDQTFAYEDGSKGDLNSRHLMLRYDNDSYMNDFFIYPVTLEADKDYQLSFDYFYGGSGGAATPTITVGAGKEVDASDRNAKNYTTTAPLLTVRTGSYIFTSTDAGTYYITFGGGRAWYGIANLFLAETDPSTDELNIVIEQAEVLYDASKEGAIAFQEAIDAAKGFLNDGYTQAQIDQAAADLGDAIWNFKFANTYTDNPLDITAKLVNPDFEEIQGDKQQTIPGWEKTGTTGENYCTRNDAGPLSGEFKTGVVYFQNWSASNTDFSISQTLTLPNGSYTLKVDAGGDEGTTGTYIYANEEEVEVTSTGEEYTIDIEVTDGTLTIGFKSETRNVNWAYADNFRLFYNGIEYIEPENCDPLSAELNLISDFHLTNLENFGGWGNKSINTDLDYVYCGETSGKVTGTNGGSIDASVTMNSNSGYRVRAQIYVAGTGQFQIGLLGGGDLIQTSKNDEWELIDYIFPTGSGSYTGLYFNCQERGGIEGYIDNWELYEWSADAIELQKLVDAANSNKAYLAELEGAGDLKTIIESAENLLDALTVDNVASKSEEIIAEFTTLQTEYNAFVIKHASPEYPADLTYMIVNPSFESDLDNWTNDGFQSQNNSGIDPMKDGSKFCEKWQSSGALPDADIHQILIELPNGFYKLTVTAVFGGEGAFIYANEDELEFGELNNYSILTEVTDGVLTIGAKLVNATANWIRFDNFRLEYTNVSAEVYDLQQEVIVLMEGAEAITGVMQNTVATQLATAIEEAEVAIDNPTLESLNVAKMAIEAAIADATASITAYADLNAVITDANDMDASGVDYDLLESAISTATATYTAADADVEAVNAAAETLRDAVVTYAVANASKDNPADVTRWVINPSFEANQSDRQQEIPGWTKTGDNNSEYCTRNDNGPLDGAFKTGNIYFQYWSQSRPDYSISQELTSLPDGVYTLVADAGGNEGTTGTYIYANENEVEVTSTGSEYSVDAKVATSATLTIGFKSVGRNVDWSYVDNFRLFYSGKTINLENNVDDALVPFAAYLQNNNLTVQFTLSAASNVEIAVYTLQGALIMKEDASFNAGENSKSFDVNALSTGVYMIQLTTDGQTFVQKVVK